MFFKIQGRVAAARCLPVLAGDAMRAHRQTKGNARSPSGKYLTNICCVYLSKSERARRRFEYEYSGRSTFFFCFAANYI